MKTYQTSGNLSSILQVAGPIAISMAIPQIQQFTNTAFLGHYSTLDQSVLGIGGIVFLFLLSFSFGTSNGAMIFFSRYSGKDDKLGLGQSFNTLITTTMIISLLVACIYFVLADRFVHMALKSPLIVYRVLDYLDVLVYSLPVFMVLQVTHSFFISIGKSSLILRVTLMGTIAHIFLDYVLIYGKLGLPTYGILGSAYATIYSEFLMLMIAFYFMYKKGYADFYKIQFFKSYHLRRAWNQVKVCFPLILQYLITLGGWLTFFTLIENMGEESLAASQSVRAAMGLCSIFVWSFAGVANSFTSNLLGQRRVSQARSTIYRIAGASVLGTSIFSLLFYFFPADIMRLLSTNSEVVHLGIGPLRVLSSSILLMALGSVLLNGLIGTGRVWVSISIEVLSVLVYLIFLAYYLIPLPATLTQMWWSEYVYWIVILLCSYIYIRSRYFGSVRPEVDI